MLTISSAFDILIGLEEAVGLPNSKDSQRRRVDDVSWVKILVRVN